MTTGPRGVPACDRSEEDVWERLDLPPDAHEASCPHCQEQRRRLQPLLQATRGLRGTPEQETEEDAVLERVRRSVMDGIRAEIRRGRRIRVRLTPRGPVDVSVYVLNEVIRRAADTIDGIELRRHGATETTARDGGPAVACQVNVQLRPGERAMEAAERLRAVVTASLADELGVTPVSVDVSVEDIIDE
jgi:uncharacterized alkaline shock family protein YloU